MTSGNGVGLALAGGVVEGGFYEVGVLCALAEAVDGLDLTRLDVYVGVSAGALVASMLANGVDARTLAAAIVGRSGDPTLDVHPDAFLTPAWGELADRLLRLPGIAARAARRVLAAPRDALGWGLVAELGTAVPTALFDGRGIERFVAAALAHDGRTNRFGDLRTRLRIAAVRLDTAELATFGAPGLDHVPISRAVQASTALPGLFCPVEIDGEHYIDGVARRTLNASLGLEEGATLLLCVNPIVPVRLTSSRDGRRSLADYGLPLVMSQTFRTVIHSRMDTAFRGYARSHPDADLVLIEPEMEENALFFSNIFSFANRRGVCELAYASTRRHLLREFDRLAPVFARHDLTLRRDVLEDPRRALFSAEGTVAPLGLGPSGLLGSAAAV
ncbi:Patatin [Gemmatirosa kalamazoonensis]|uniref:Patatin n=1 Tax=Gemmatirosa kalamazoonensis TaxID=861299 RepID=W0RL74_9BACT|nr:patatin-like phospholipase family protein [Gemmatirosa kalamazoonensis]AHG91829.1 Patatin [Gemmatirosa kalamazoonensis]